MGPSRSGKRDKRDSSVFARTGGEINLRRARPGPCTRFPGYFDREHEIQIQTDGTDGRTVEKFALRVVLGKSKSEESILEFDLAFSKS